MNKLIYVETSIPSFYTETRSDEEVRIRRKWTREWWHLPHTDQDRVTSFVVHEELARLPDPVRREAALDLIRPLEQFIYTPDIAEIIEVYLAHKLMPREGLGDAAHLALASHNRCDILVTWNCRHLANANKADHIRRVNALLGLETPLLVTPLELLELDNETEA
jgi:predicted nucleic acid-binding protein